MPGARGRLWFLRITDEAAEQTYGDGLRTPFGRPRVGLPAADSKV
jgi:hypothetical protein